jgi:hypothetical protein
MSDEFLITAPIVRSEGVGVPVNEIQRAINSICQQTTADLNVLASQPQNPTGPAGGDLSGSFPNPTVSKINGVTASSAGGAGQIGYAQGGTGAVTETVAAKFQQGLSVIDFGADRTGAVDSTTAFQNAINAANPLGVDVFIPGGTYKLSSAITLDNSADGTQTSLRTSLVGTNPHGCVLNFGTGAYNCITIKGSNTNGGADSLQRCENLFVNKADNLGIGFAFEQHSHLQVKNCRVNGANTGMYCQDVQESTFENCLVAFANGGFVAIPFQSFTAFNAITFLNCKFGNCNQFGLDLQNVAAVNFFGGSIEGNTTNSASQVTWGVRCIINADATLQGTVGVNFFGTYIENNGFNGTPNTPNADIWIVNSTSPSTYNIVGCSFQRHSFFSTNCIRLDTSGAFQQNLNITGCGFRGYSDYTASAGRPYWLVSTPAPTTQVSAIGNTYQSATETPTNLLANSLTKVFSANTSAQSIPNNAFTVVTGWTNTFDSHGDFTASAGVFTAPVAGFYEVAANISFGALTGGAGVAVAASIFVGGVERARGTLDATVTSTFGVTGSQVKALLSLTAGQTVTIEAFQNSGSAATLNANAVNNYVSIVQLP